MVDMAVQRLTPFIPDSSCRDLADLYLKAIKENRVEGYRKKSPSA
jgi:hypothetical protein